MIGTADFTIGDVAVRGSERTITGPRGTCAVEPLVMQLFLHLAGEAGRVVGRRDLFRVIWGNSSVGEDSLNRLVAALRKALTATGADLFSIGTVPGAGYILQLAPAALVEAPPALAEAADACWWAGVPRPDHLLLERLRLGTERHPESAALHGWRALMSRHAAEYAPPVDTADHVEVCRRSADRALALDPECEPAAVALTSVLPLFRNWREAHERLSAFLALHPGAELAAHDLAMVEMATGFPARAKAICDELRQRRPLTATLAYKAIYQYWSVGHPDVERISEQAITLWPAHPAVWTARFWTQVFGGRLHAAAGMLEQSSSVSLWPPALLSFLRLVLAAKGSGQEGVRQQAVSASLDLGRRGPMEANTALFALSLLGAVDEALDLCDAYYLGTGEAVPDRPQQSAPPVNDQYRRVTQILFTPVGVPFRQHPRFTELTERVGLVDYWQWLGRVPDYQAA